VASEVTHRSKRRLYGLKHLAPLREAAAAPRHPVPGRRRGRPSAASRDDDGDGDVAQIAAPLSPSPPLPPLERGKFEFAELDRWLDLTDQAIRRVERVLADQALPRKAPRLPPSAPIRTPLS